MRENHSFIIFDWSGPTRIFIDRIDEYMSSGGKLYGLLGAKSKKGKDRILQFDSAQDWKPMVEAFIDKEFKEATEPTENDVKLREFLFTNWKGCINHDCIVNGPKIAGANTGCNCVVNASKTQLYILQSRLSVLLNNNLIDADELI